MASVRIRIAFSQSFTLLNYQQIKTNLNYKIRIIVGFLTTKLRHHDLSLPNLDRHCSSKRDFKGTFQ